MCIYFSSKSHYFLTQAAEAIIKHSEQVYAGLHSMCLSSITIVCGLSLTSLIVAHSLHEMVCGC